MRVILWIEKGGMGFKGVVWGERKEKVNLNLHKVIYKNIFGDFFHKSIPYHFLTIPKKRGSYLFIKNNSSLILFSKAFKPR